ncbi:hypothetical protein AB9K34_02815 [Sedimentitalea sp. XS_ASV28]|uniref:hypothetical protein n=1 Tax=Sedimentitalea sp. XS_ASV28 TaxID=3241296 RepID=UPI00351178B0
MNAHHLLAAMILSVGLGGVSSFASAEGDVAPALPQTTRVLPYHIYEERQQARDVTVPHGYKPVWHDGRLNPQRGITTLKPTGTGTHAFVPRGYKAAWTDGRLNPNRGQGTARGDAQSDQVWSQTVPRLLVPAAPPPQLYGGPTPRKQQKTRFWETAR